MSSRDSHIHDDIKKLLQEESLTPEMERVISVLGGVRPRVDIDKNYQKKLRAKLLQPQKKSSPKWSIYIPALSGVFAICIVVLGYMRIVAPVPTVTDTGHTTLTVESVMTGIVGVDNITPPEDIPTPQAQVERVADKSEKVIPVESALPESKIADIPMPQMAMMKNTEQAPEPSMMRESSPLMMANPVVSDAGGGDMMATTSADMMATTSPMPSDTTLEDEMSLMIHDINTILSDTSRMSSITLPVYPATMLIYEKSGVFTDAETRSPEQYGLTARSVPTIQDANALKQKILTLAGDATLASSGSIIYVVHIRGDVSLLIPSVSYTLSSGGTISVPLVSGY